MTAVESPALELTLGVASFAATRPTLPLLA